MRPIVCIILFLLSLSGCVTTPSFCPPHAESTKYWTMNASMAIQAQESRSSGSFQMEWLQRGDQYVINGSGPLGATLFMLTGQAHHVLLRTGDGRVLQASTPEQLLKNQFGWQWPVSSMVYWVTGKPAPDQPVRRVFDAAHHLVQFVQQGWTVTFLRFNRVNGLLMPIKILLEKEPIKIKLVVHQWLLC